MRTFHEKSVLNISWKNAFLDTQTIVVSLLLLMLPVILYSTSIVYLERAEKLSSVERSVQNSLYEIETLTDHINGALINLITTELDCSGNSVKQMHELSFELLGVEAFYVLDSGGKTLCTNWLDNFSSFDIKGVQRQAGINFSNEVYLSSIKRNGVYIYRLNTRNQFVGALVASTFFRQVLNQGVPAGDTLVFYNRHYDQPMAINGIVSTEGLSFIRQAIQANHSTVYDAGNGNMITYSVSAQYPDLLVAYLFPRKSAGDIIGFNTTEILTIWLLSLLVAIGWFRYRHEKINSYPYQLRKALKHQEFFPSFQPIVDMRTGQCLGVEILARWYRYGAIVAFPDEFIGKAEKYGLLKALTRQVTMKSIGLMEDIIAEHPDFYFSINFSPNQMDQASVGFVTSLLAQYQTIQAKNICFEITEQGLAEVNQDRFRQTVEQLNGLGFHFGLDDFGAGQSGLEYFSNITPNFLKIDRRFVSAISSPQSVDFQILKTIVQLAKTLNISVVAEGIETERHARWLTDQGIQKGQGWLYYKPMDDLGLREVLQRQKISLS